MTANDTALDQGEYTHPLYDDISVATLRLNNQIKGGVVGRDMQTIGRGPVIAAGEASTDSRSEFEVLPTSAT